MPPFMSVSSSHRFALDIDLDAPIVRVPIRTCASSKCDSHLVLDLGHFTLHTKVCMLIDRILFMT